MPSTDRARTAVAAVDVELSDRAMGRGIRVSPERVRRWRRYGLLPTPDLIGVRPPGAPPGRLPKRYSPERLVRVDSGVDVLVKYSRRGRNPNDLTLIIFAHGLPIDGELVRAAITSTVDATRVLISDLIGTAQARFPSPTDPDLELDTVFERAEALALMAVVEHSSSVRDLRANLRASGGPVSAVDLVQIATRLFEALGGQGGADHDDEIDVSADVMRALGMEGLLESVAADVPPLLENGPREFMEAAAAAGRLAFEPLPADLNDEELFRIRDFVVLLAGALAAVPDPSLLHHLGGPGVAALWDPADPVSIAIGTTLLVQLERANGALDPSPLVEAIREQGWLSVQGLPNGQDATTVH